MYTTTLWMNAFILFILIIWLCRCWLELNLDAPTSEDLYITKGWLLQNAQCIKFADAPT